MSALQPFRAQIWRLSRRNPLLANDQVCKGISTRLLRVHRHPFSNCTTLRANDDAYPAFKSSSRLRGRTCMITGGTSGIGFAIARRFLEEDAQRIILVGRSYERLRDAARRLDGSLPESEVSGGVGQGVSVNMAGRISLLVGDVSEAGLWMRELEREMKHVDILVNAAGISINGILPKIEPEDISRILRTNLEGSIMTSRALMRATIRNRLESRKQPAAAAATTVQPPPRSKCIINISSLLATKGGTGAVTYAASKMGILGLTRAVAAEAASSLRDVVIRSNAIVPGYIETPMIADFSPGETARLKESIPLGRFGDPREIADAAVFLAQNEYANNCVLNIDGGLSAL